MNRIVIISFLFLISCTSNTPEKEVVSQEETPAKESLSIPVNEPGEVFYSDLSLDEKQEISSSFLTKKGKIALEVKRVNLKLRLAIYAQCGRVDDVLFKQSNGDLTKKNDFVGNSKLIDIKKGMYNCEGICYLVNGKKKTKKSFSVDYQFTGFAKGLETKIILK